MTLSGGEPLLQKAFSKALLERAKAEGVHTAIETCGNYRWSDLGRALPFIDMAHDGPQTYGPGDPSQGCGCLNERILVIAEQLMYRQTCLVPHAGDSDGQ